MNRNPSLLEGLGAALLVALLVTAGIILASFENPARELSSVKTESTAHSSPNSISNSTPTQSPYPTSCPQPEGWEPYIIQNGDSLELLAEERQTNIGEVMSANCLSRPGALPGTSIFLPPRPPTLTPTITQSPSITSTQTITLRPCVYPSGWKRYEIKPGDTLFKLGVRFRISEVDLVTGNCLSLGSAFHPGYVLLVPEQPTATPTPRK